MLEYTVSTKAQLIAAIKAAAQPTFGTARSNPVHIQLGTTHYHFREGLQQQHADHVIRNIKQISEKYFNVTDQHELPL